MKALKDIYTHRGIFKTLAEDMCKVCPKIDQALFYQALVANLDELELKARIERAADVCCQFLPKDYLKSLNILYRFLKNKESRLIYLFLPTYIAKYGREHYDASILAIRDMTEYSSSEEGVRTFIEMRPDQTLAIMLQWTKSKNEHIRRLASEGCRPRLPWAKKINFLIEQPELAWPILEALKTDPAKYVQKSVANHINDITKDHPDCVVARVGVWDMTDATTYWIVKHGMRTLIKQGHKGALRLFGNAQKPQVQISGVKWKKKVVLGEAFDLNFDIVSKSKQVQSLVIDYQMFFCKKSGVMQPKTFKLKQCMLKPNEVLSLKTKYAFKDLSTRKHYSGPHAWQLRINGELLEKYPYFVGEA